MPSFGEKLKQERLKRSITLEQISISTKIGTRMLQALEDDKFNQLPGGIFNKGFVRSYARFVGLDEDQTVADYLEASGEAAPKSPADAEPILAPPPKAPEPSPSRPLPWGLFAILLLLVALSLAVWSRRQHSEQTRAAAPPPAAETPVSQPAANPIPAAESTSSAPATTLQPPPTQPAESKPVTKPVPKPPTTSSAANNAAPAQSAPAPAEEFTVVVLAREDSWLSINADGASVFADTIVGGNQRSIHARKEVVIRAGNAGALDFVFNGKKLPPQGDIGDVRILTFGPAGLLHAGAAPASPQ